MLNPNQLKYFVDTIKLGSSQRAAELNFVTPSAISQGIRNLELCLDKKLLEHKKNNLSLTQEGLRIFKLAQKMVKEISIFENECLSSEKSIPDHFSIMLNQSLADTYLENIIASIHHENPSCKLNILVGNSRAMKSKLLEHKIDLAIGLKDQFLEDFQFVPLLAGQFFFYKKKKNKNEHYYIGDQGEEVQKASKYFSKNKLTYTQIQSWSVLHKLAHQGLGSALLPEYIIKNKSLYNITNHGLKFKPYQIGLFSNYKLELGRLSIFRSIR